MDEYKTIKDLPIVVQKSMIAYGFNAFSTINFEGETYCSAFYKPKGLVKSVNGRPRIYRLLGENSYRLSTADASDLLHKLNHAQWTVHY